MVAIDADMIASAFFFVAILLFVISAPHILYTTVRGEYVVRMHMSVRNVDPEGEVSKTQMKFLELRKDKMIFHKTVGEELERLSGMKNTVPLAIISAVIIAVMMFWPGFTNDVLPVIIVILAVLVVCVLGSLGVTELAVKRYIMMLDETSQESHHPESMYQ